MSEVERSHSRKVFLGGALGVATAAGLWGGRAAHAAAGVSRNPSVDTAPSLPVTDARFVGETFFLDLGGEGLATVDSVDGGVVSADVIELRDEGGRTATKHIGNTKWGDIELKRGVDPQTRDWAKICIAAEPQPVNATVLAADARLTHTATMNFRGALIAELAFPALDAASNDGGFMTVRFAPDTIEYAKGSGRTLRAATRTDPRQWQVQSFKLTIDGFDEAARVSKVGAFTIKQGSAGELDFSNLKLSFPAANATKWITWHDDFVIAGNNGPAFEKTASLQLFNRDGGSLIELTFRGVGIVSVSASRDPDAGGTASATAELYVEDLAFKF
jgi:phage tail-like protein